MLVWLSSIWIEKSGRHSKVKKNIPPVVRVSNTEMKYLYGISMVMADLNLYVTSWRVERAENLRRGVGHPQGDAFSVYIWCSGPVGKQLSAGWKNDNIFTVSQVIW
jgi:hypothetical protein